MYETYEYTKHDSICTPITQQLDNLNFKIYVQKFWYIFTQKILLIPWKVILILPVYMSRYESYNKLNSEVLFAFLGLHVCDITISAEEPRE